MLIGYSLLLREYLAATEVDYGDCEEFQITCPVCHEAIFKAGHYGHDRQYFSHYAASKSDVRECELRVAAFSVAHIAEVNSAGEAQSMEKFFERFREFVMAWVYADQAPDMRRRANWMLIRPSFLRYVDTLRRVNAVTHTAALQDHKDFFLKVRSRYWVNRQFAFAADFKKHLMAPNSAPAFGFMMAVSVMLNLRVPESFRLLLIEAKERPLQKGLDRLFLTDPEAFETYVIEHVVGFGTLTRLIPYIDMLSHRPRDSADNMLLLRMMSHPHDWDKLDLRSVKWQ